MAITTEQIKKLRQATGAPVLDVKKALEAVGGDFDKAVIWLREKGLTAAAKKGGREARNGVVELYSHGEGRVGVMVEVNCETDFVARTESFRHFAHEVALQVAAANPRWLTVEEVPADVLEREREIARRRALEEGRPETALGKIAEGRLQKFLDEAVLMRQPYIRDEKRPVSDLLKENIGQIGENIVIRRFTRWELGDTAD